MIIDDAYRYVFIAIPKTGSISIQFSLGHTDIPEPDDYHQGLSKVLNNKPEVIDYFKFAIVRNPWARILSLYNDFTLKRGKQYSHLVTHDKPLFSEFKDFEDFCVNVKHTNWINNIFLQSQYSLLSHNDEYAINYVGRFENIVEDYQRICNYLKIYDKPLQKMNVGKYDNRSYREYYTDKSIEAIEQLYKQDIKKFCYDF